MADFSLLIQLLKDLSIYEWRDGIEIIILAAILYRAISWLAQDKSQLLDYAYSYLGLFFLSYFGNFQTLSSLLALLSPAFIMLCITAHQKSLQQHFITIKRRFHETKYDWISALMQTMLVAMNKNKAITCVLERTESLEPFIATPTLIDGRIDEYFLTALIESPHFQHENFMWCNQKGKILGFNGQWKSHDDYLWLEPEVREEHRWKQEAIFYSLKADCIIVKMYPSMRAYDVILDGSIAEKISAAQLAHILENAYGTPYSQTSSKKMLRNLHGISFKKSSQEQQL